MVAQRMTRSLGDSSQNVNMSGGTVNMGAWSQQQVLMSSDSGLHGQKLTALSLEQLCAGQHQNCSSTPTPSEVGFNMGNENSCPAAGNISDADYFAYVCARTHFAYAPHEQMGMNAGYQPMQVAQPSPWPRPEQVPTVFYSYVVPYPLPSEPAVSAEWGCSGDVTVDANSKQYGNVDRQVDRQGRQRERWSNKKISREQALLLAAKGPEEVETFKRAAQSTADPCKNHGSKTPSGIASTSGGSECESPDLSDPDGQSESHVSAKSVGVTAHVVKPKKAPSMPPRHAVDSDEPAYHLAGDHVMTELDTDGPRRQIVLDSVLKSFWPMALSKRGCRILQKALDVGSPAYRQILVENLRGQVHRAYQSPHANYVLQKIIEVMPSEHYNFVLEELDQQVLFVVRHRFGCRILQRLLEHCPLDEIDPMMNKVMSDVKALLRHQYGNFVLQHILQYGSPAHRHIIAEVVHADIIRLAKHHLASHVVSCAMVHCATEDVKALVHAVLHDAGQLAQLSRREFGSFVVREANRVARILGV